MQPVEIKKDVYWVGAIDWNLRNFHGYLTQRGSTYNAYLIVDEQITLIDTVKAPFADEMIERISKVIDPSKIDNIVCDHVEMDHSGSLPKILEHCPDANVYCSKKAVDGLQLHYGDKINPIVAPDELNIGSRTLKFVETPMVHWPDNMVVYCEPEKILFSNDSFGQHLACSERFDDEYPVDIINEEAKKYYANIVLPFSPMVKKVLTALEGLDIEIIAPSHGIIWRSCVQNIIKKYKKWANSEVDEKAVIVYDTMWGSTEKIAKAISRKFEEKGIKFELISLQNSHMSDIMTLVMDAKYICVGSPTLNNNMLPTVAGFLAYFKGLAPAGRTAMAFGSFGWGGQSVGQVEDILKGCGYKMMEPVRAKYIPSQEILDGISLDID